MIPVKVKRVNKDAVLPYKATTGSAGYDICANIEEEIVIHPMEIRLISTGIKMELPVGYEAQIRPRSGLSAKHGVTLVNCVGTIDEDFRGEVKVPLINLSNTAYFIQPRERIAQMIIAKLPEVELFEVEEISETVRSEGSFGSSGRI